MYINKCNGNKTKMKLKGGKKTRVTIKFHNYTTDKLINQFINPNET